MPNTKEQDEATRSILLHVESIRVHLHGVVRGTDATADIQYSLDKIKDVFALHDVPEIKQSMDEKRKRLFGHTDPLYKAIGEIADEETADNLDLDDLD